MNILLLPKTALCHHTKTAAIDNPLQLSHLTTVLDVDVGHTLKIGELGGNIGTATIDALSQKCCHLSDVVLDTPPPPKLGVTVILALPRPKVLRRLLLDMTAMGVAHIILINSYRTDKSYWQSPLLTRIDEFVWEGLQQGMDTIVPTVHCVKRFKPFVQDELSVLIRNKKAVVAHPYATKSFAQYSQVQLPDVVVIGAEGGFIAYEIELLASIGVEAVTLGKRILRTESAVNAVLGRWLM